MVHELRVPSAGESIQEVQIGQWLKKEGQWVERDESVVELETDKASMDLRAPVAGMLTRIMKQEGEATAIGEVIGLLDETAQPSAAPSRESEPGPLPEPLVIMPAAQRLLQEHGIQAREVEATGPAGRLLKEDVLRYLEQHKEQGGEAARPAGSISARQLSGGAEVREEPAAAPRESLQESRRGTARAPEPEDEALAASGSDPARQEEAVPMSLIRRRIAERLVQAQQNAALLTTYNEIDMGEVVELRRRHRERFEQRHGVKLGFLSFFTKAVIEALKECPALNAEIRENQIVYRNYYDIGIAIGGGKGLVVPSLRNAERLSFAEIEKKIGDFDARARENKIRPEELVGGTFTITNGGVYGSLLSTPIINPPQSGVLGLHAIQDRPVAREGQVVIRPMMYVALTYDHRIVDGREAVTFLRRIKEIIEEPARMLLEI